ncbi:MAG: sulfite exporter TauE/SafE family protein [Gomphosphaeria aponina SAG 52.96 = DSM 107014]|uniref:Probable membrane transporter protein n=1 Tax=Gomphosphaeria aponina SAG 52.96 = DSM 107014 TaxID=1521640 RepID=A0A941GMP9_9CHRO|nr:sulfite exporter TauE/SafE family protein [Gomphosphaeria aponina SAG 52.96 = DSM 107014]
MEIVGLALASSISWFLSTLAGGGSPLILIPVIGLCLGAAAVPPVVTTGMLLGNIQRVWIYWRYIDWQVMWWYLPGSIVGAVLGAFVFTQTNIKWLPVLLGIFLILSTLSYGVGKNKPSFKVSAWYFLPAALIYAFLSGIIGSTGPMLNPLYFNYGMVKEDMIATKAANVVVVHIAKMIAYAAFGALTPAYLFYGIIIGIAAFPGNWVGQIVLEKISKERFRQLVVVFVAFSGMLMLWEQRALFVVW